MLGMIRPAVSAAIVILVAAAPALGDALRIATWNVSDHPNTATDEGNLATVLGHINTSVGALDLMAFQESDTNSVTRTLNVFQNTFGGTFSSAAAPVDVDGNFSGFIFDTSALSLVGSTTAITGLGHPALRGQFRPAGTNGSADFYVYSIHLRNGSTTADLDARFNEAGLIRADADALPAGAAILYLGDLNLIGPDERGPNPTQSAWDVLVAPGGAQAFDPANMVGNWRDNAAYKSVHTQSAATEMDDRYDFQLMTGALVDGEGVEYVNGSYLTVGNNGTHTLNGAITTGTGAPADVLTALAAFSSHLPVVATYQIPEPAGAAALSGAAILVLLRRRRQRQ